MDLARRCSRVVPIANTLPDGGTDVVVAEQLSAATGAKVTTTPSGPVASTVIGPGHAMRGDSTSFTVTLNEQDAEPFTAALVAVELTRVVPTSNALPDFGVDAILMSGHMPSAVTPKLTTALH
jgi:hypothetical protein